MDIGTIVARSVEVLANPKKTFWEEQLKKPVEDSFFESFYIPFVSICGVLVSLPYLSHGVVPAIMMGLLSGGILWGMPYLLTWMVDSVATGMGGVGFGRQTTHLWALLQVPLGLGMALGAITEPFANTQVLAFAGLAYGIYLSCLFVPEVYRIPSEKRVVFLVAVGTLWFFALVIGRAFLTEVTRAMWLSTIQHGGL
jgi:hypothetical protein